MRFHFRFLSPSPAGLGWTPPGRERSGAPGGRSGRRRSACQHGSYTVGGKTCCLCAAGQRLSQHCEDTPEDRVCEYCDPGKTYSSVPNAETTCEPCTSCTRRANLEVKEECTITKDAVCQCIEDHYCSSRLCTTCYPCDKWTSQDTKQLLEGVDIKPHVEEIAKVLEWEVMRNVAMESGFTSDDIEILIENLHYPTKWTPLLLHQWVEKMEKKDNNAARELVEKLTGLGYTYQRDRVIRFLYEREKKPTETQPLTS
ncbi:Tumor necrosis factor receptor superfamily member 6 [Merluccius polli]|uniref:Tumor necrosis factor receptor superfamily member 6 n=1 Tax=Merluccius polli TaxID=89951 RepID=A0AA47P6L3_MERPO|nr:Tumor necrosis factor receptor superfamily member 6 [Merluccius polli]